MEFVQLTETQFMEYEQTHALGMFMQTSYQKQLVSKRGWTSEYVGVLENNVVVAAGLLNSTNIFLGKLYELSGGPILDYRNSELLQFFIKEVKAYAKKRKGLVLRIIPNLHDAVYDEEGNLVKELNAEAKQNLLQAGARYEQAQPVTDDHYSPVSLSFEFIKTLQEKDEQSLIQSYNKNGKYYLTKTKEFGIHYRELGYEELPLFKQYTAETSARIGFKDKDLAYYQEAYRAYGDQVKYLIAELDLVEYQSNQQMIIQNITQELTKLEAELVATPNHKKKKNRAKELKAQIEQHQKRVAEAEEMRTANEQSVIILAGGMFIIQPQEITYLFSFTNEAFKKFYAPYGIQHKMMLEAIERGIPQYNFYGVKGVFDGSDGVLRFKQSFGGYTYRYLGIFTFIVNPVKEKVANAIKQLLRRN